ncbi:hypothetical protein N7490_000261 [Penicillium lividum]|nr:hypothetical protein N7490_000261 [Penicillium lividum]
MATKWISAAKKSNRNHGHRTDKPSNPSSQATNPIPRATKPQSTDMKKQRPCFSPDSKRDCQEARTLEHIQKSLESLANKEACGESGQKNVPDSGKQTSILSDTLTLLSTVRPHSQFYHAHFA